MYENRKEFELFVWNTTTRVRCDMRERNSDSMWDFCTIWRDESPKKPFENCHNNDLWCETWVSKEWVRWGDNYVTIESFALVKMISRLRFSIHFLLSSFAFFSIYVIFSVFFCCILSGFLFTRTTIILSMFQLSWSE